MTIDIKSLEFNTLPKSVREEHLFDVPTVDISQYTFNVGDSVPDGEHILYDSTFDYKILLKALVEDGVTTQAWSVTKDNEYEELFPTTILKDGCWHTQKDLDELKRFSIELKHLTKTEPTQEFVTEWNNLETPQRWFKMKEFGMVYNPFTEKPQRSIGLNYELHGKWDDGRSCCLQPFDGSIMKLMEIKDNKVIALYKIDMETNIIGTEDILEEDLKRYDE